MLSDTRLTGVSIVRWTLMISERRTSSRATFVGDAMKPGPASADPGSRFWASADYAVAAPSSTNDSSASGSLASERTRPPSASADRAPNATTTAPTRIAGISPSTKA